MLEICLCIWNTSLASIMKVPGCSKTAEPVRVFALFFQLEIKKTEWKDSTVERGIWNLAIWLQPFIKMYRLLAAVWGTGSIFFKPTASCGVQTHPLCWNHPLPWKLVALWSCCVQSQHLENGGIQRNLCSLRREKQTSFLAGIDPAGSLFPP